MPASADISKLLESYDVLLGGLGPTIEISDFNSTEKDLFDKAMEYIKTGLARVSPTIASDFEDQIPMIEAFAKVFKAKINEATFGGLLPSSGQFGVAPIIPQDIKYVDTPTAQQPAYTDYPGNSWILKLAAGAPVYLFGSATNFYKANPVVGQRTMMVIIKNGLVEIGTTPKINQIKVDTEKINYAPFRIHPLVDQTIEREKQIYQYETPFAIPIWYDFGIKIKAMPVDSGTSDLRIIGVIFYEAGYYSDVKYIPTK